MKTGFIFECGPDGADKQVCEYLARTVRPDIEPISRTLDNKPRLFQDCGLVAARLFTDGCERVFVIWDLRPPGRDSRRAGISSAPRSSTRSPRPVWPIGPYS